MEKMYKKDYTQETGEREWRAARERAGDLRLLIVSSKEGVRNVALSDFGADRLTIGRSEGSDIVLDVPSVSGTHAKLKREGGELYLADLSSTNGTYAMSGGGYVRLRANQYVGPLREGMIFLLGGSAKHKCDAQRESVLVVVTDGEDAESWKQFPLFDEEYVIGKDRDCDIRFAHPAVSRHHARIFKEGGTVYIEDMGSTNGVFVNGDLIYEKYALEEKDIVQIGLNLLVFSGDMLIGRTHTEGIQLAMYDLVKKVDGGRKKILSHVTCAVESNEFVAIVGGSGAGKSTLLKTLGGYDKFYEGDVFYNGISLKRHYNILKNIIGYVPQEDIVFENLTLKRMLYYTAKLKMPDGTPMPEIEQRIQEVLRLIELTEHQNTMIKNLSGGQKKRASIAVELLADPGMFFLDEPTSGLDPGTEQKLMRVLNRLSKTQGKTIVMVTHTTQSLDLCDKIIFMGKGGRLAFMGTPAQAKMFFQTDSLVEIYNLLEEDTEGWAAQFDRLNELPEIQESAQDSVKKPKRKSAFLQLATLTGRYGELVRNDLQRLGLLMIQPILIAFLIKIVASKDVFSVYGPTQQILFTFSCSGIWIGIFNTIQEVCKERAIVKREYMSNLRLTTYILSKYLVQFLISLAQTLLFVGLFALLMDLPKDGARFSCLFELFVTMWLTIYASSALGLLVSSVMKNGDRAMAVSPFLLIIQLLFSGILFELKGSSEVISYFTVSRWSVEAMGNIVDLNGMNQVPDGGKEMFRHGFSHLSQTWLILAMFIVILAVLSILFLRNVEKDR